MIMCEKMGNVLTERPRDGKRFNPHDYVLAGRTLVPRLRSNDGIVLGTPPNSLHQTPDWLMSVPPSDSEATRLQWEHKMRKRLTEELISDQPFSPATQEFITFLATGTPVRINQRKQHRASMGQNFSAQPTLAAYAEDVFVHPAHLSNRQRDYRILRADGGIHPAVRDWSLPPSGQLKKLIDAATGQPDIKLLGGGLPEEELISKFIDLVSEAMGRVQTKCSRAEKVEMGQYPNAGGAPRHRQYIFDHYLGAAEKKIIQDNFGFEKRHEGLFLTYGSQEALNLMGAILVDQEKATPQNPVEIAVTDPTYAGLLMALDEYTKPGLIKFVTVPLDRNGKIDTTALEQALSRPRCKAFYLAEGNPLPKKITNLKEVAALLNEKRFEEKLVFEDRAYKDLGATVDDALIHLVPGKVITFETFSKKGAPFRVGLTSSNMNPESFAFIRDNMLHIQYDRTLGYSGLLSGAVFMILSEDDLREKFFQHMEEVKRVYEAKRAIYAQTYREAFDLAYGDLPYALSDKVVFADEMFMFGLRISPIPATLFGRAKAMMKEFSLSGESCTPNPNHVINQANRNSPTLYYERENYTWSAPEALRKAIYISVLAEIACLDPNLFPIEKKGEAIGKLRSKLIELNGGKEMPEVDQFVEITRQHNWTFTPDLLPAN